MRWLRLRFHPISSCLLIPGILLCAVWTAEAKPNIRTALLNRQSWTPSWSTLTSGITTLSSYLPSLSAPPSLGLLQTPAFADLGAYLTDTMPAFSDVYASIPSWEQWQGLMPHLPRPSQIFNQLPTEVQNGMQQMWSQMNPLDVEQFRRRQYRRGVVLMLGLAGYYNGYQGMYKQYRKGIEAYVEPHQRKKKFNEMKRVCYYELPQEGDEDFLEPSMIKPGLCTHIVVSHAKVGEHGNVVLPMDQINDGRLEQILADLKKAAPSVLLCVSGGSQNEFSPMAAEKHHRLKFIRSSVGIARRYGLSGIDFDWEFPSVGAENPDVAENLATLVEDFRDYMDPWVKKEKEEKDSKKFILTATVSAMPQTISKSYNVKRLSRHLDWVNVMAYDYGIKQNGFQVMDHNAPLFDHSGRPAGLNVATTGMKWAQEGMPHEKIVIGLPLFGRSYIAGPNFLKRTGTHQTVDAADSLAHLQHDLELDGVDEAGNVGAFPSSTRIGSLSQPYKSSATIGVPEYQYQGHQFDEALVGGSHQFNDASIGRKPIVGAIGAHSELNDPFTHPSHASFVRDLTTTIGGPSLGPGMDGGFVPYGKICSLVTNGTLRIELDTKAKVPVATDGINWISFDDTVSASMKSRWVEDMGFGGVALYNLNMDDWKGNCDPNKTPFQMLRAVWKMLG